MLDVNGRDRTIGTPVDFHTNIHTFASVTPICAPFLISSVEVNEALNVLVGITPLGLRYLSFGVLCAFISEPFLFSPRSSHVQHGISCGNRRSSRGLFSSDKIPFSLRTSHSLDAQMFLSLLESYISQAVESPPVRDVADYQPYAYSLLPDQYSTRITGDSLRKLVRNPLFTAYRHPA